MWRGDARNFSAPAARALRASATHRGALYLRGWTTLPAWPHGAMTGDVQCCLPAPRPPGSRYAPGSQACWPGPRSGSSYTRCRLLAVHLLVDYAGAATASVTLPFFYSGRRLVPGRPAFSRVTLNRRRLLPAWSSARWVPGWPTTAGASASGFLPTRHDRPRRLLALPSQASSPGEGPPWPW